MKRFDAVTAYAKYKAVVPLFSVTLLLLACCGCAYHNVGAVPLPPSYLGPPQFERVSGTPDVLYAANSADEVLHAGNAYYLRLQGAWFTSGDPAGPWRRTNTVPREFETVACTPLGQNSPFEGNEHLCVGPIPKVYLPRGPY